MKPKKAELVKEYFFTGHLEEDNPFPLFYVLRFYPGDDAQWFKECLLNAHDSALGRYVVMYHVDSLGPHNQRFADFYYSSEMTDRLKRILDYAGKGTNRKFVIKRDFEMTKNIYLAIARAFREYSPFPDHHRFCIGDKWFDIAQDYDSRNNKSNDSFVKYISKLVNQTALYLGKYNQGNLGENESILLKKTVSLLDTTLRDEHGLREKWLQSKEKASN